MATTIVDSSGDTLIVRPSGDGRTTILIQEGRVTAAVILTDAEVAKLAAALILRAN